MTLDDLDLFSKPSDDWPPAEVVEREPRKCRRHQWKLLAELDGTKYPGGIVACWRCSAVQDVKTSRRGKNSRARGNAFEREVAAKLGGVRKGQYGDKVDVEVPGWLRVQCKNGTAYPERMDGWLRAIPFQADILRAVVLGDAPGSAGKRRSLIVLDLDEFASWYGKR